MRSVAIIPAWRGAGAETAGRKEALPVTQDRYDSGSRYIIKLQPKELIRWRLRGEVAFRAWLDTRTLPFPGTPQQICDTVCRCEEADGRPWAIPVESQTQPHPDMFGRVTAYLGMVALEVHPDPEPGSRFCVAAIVFNLTGTGNTSRDFRLGKAKLRTCVQVDECDLASLDAQRVLRQIARGKVPRCVLGWIPLMQKGVDPATLQQWRRLAEGEPDPRSRADYGALAKVFAELAGCQDVWNAFLEGWNVRESQIVQEWLAEGLKEERLNTLRRTLRLLLEDRFGPLPEGVRQRIDTASDPDRLERAIRQFPRLGSLEELTL
jgi:hypothetical protein